MKADTIKLNNLNCQIILKKILTGRKNGRNIGSNNKLKNSNNLKNKSVDEDN